MASNEVAGVLLDFWFGFLGFWFFICCGGVFVCLFWPAVGFGALFVVVLGGFVYLFIVWVFGGFGIF